MTAIPAAHWGMRLLRSVSEDDMVAAFLAAEVTSERYGPQIRQILARLGQPHRLVTDPDTCDQAANAARRQVLAAYRDYPTGDVFTGMPADVRWHRAMLTPAELGTAQYIDYPYWTDFSGGTRLVADGARRLGPWGDQPAGTIYRQIAENARDGRLPPPIILVSEPGLANLVVIEGHKRLTGLLVCPQWLPAELEVVLGITASHDK
jgi:hypothetical protein